MQTRDTYFVIIRKSRLPDYPRWLIKLYPPGAASYFDYEESTKTETFADAIRVADYFLGVR